MIEIWHFLKRVSASMTICTRFPNLDRCSKCWTDKFYLNRRKQTILDTSFSSRSIHIYSNIVCKVKCAATVHFFQFKQSIKKMHMNSLPHLPGCYLLSGTCADFDKLNSKTVHSEHSEPYPPTHSERQQGGNQSRTCKRKQVDRLTVT